MKLVLTCEHAFNTIPQEYKHLFEGAEEVLESHRGYDPGAFDLFSLLSELANFSQAQKTARLLVEVNRSVGHQNLFSEFTEELISEEKEKLLKEHYFPYRNSVEKKIAEFIKKGEEVWHLSVHSFTPQLKGETRNADIGLLYDPSRKMEKKISADFKRLLQEEIPALKIRYNYPYLGKADGFTTYLRKKFPKQYAGIELEVNQKFTENNRFPKGLKSAVLRSVREILENK